MEEHLVEAQGVSGSIPLGPTINIMATEPEVIDWNKAGRSFRRLLKQRGDVFARLCDARTYERLYVEDELDDEGAALDHRDAGSISG